MSEYGLLPAVHPPIASRVINPGLILLKALTSAYLQVKRYVQYKIQTEDRQKEKKNVSIVTDMHVMNFFMVTYLHIFAYKYPKCENVSKGHNNCKYCRNILFCQKFLYVGYQQISTGHKNMNPLACILCFVVPFKVDNFVVYKLPKCVCNVCTQRRVDVFRMKFSDSMSILSPVGVIANSFVLQGS